MEERFLIGMYFTALNFHDFSLRSTFVYSDFEPVVGVNAFPTYFQ